MVSRRGRFWKASQIWESEREQECLVGEKQPRRCPRAVFTRGKGLTHVTLYVAQEEKLGSWEGDLAYICISRCVVYTRAGAGDFIFIFKTSFPSSFRFTERLGKSNCNIEKSPGQCAWAQYDRQMARLTPCTAVARAPASLQPHLIPR